MMRKLRRWTAGRKAAAILRSLALMGAVASLGAAFAPPPARADAPSFVTAALAVEREALAGVMARRGAVDLDAVNGRVMPRGGTAELDHLDVQDRLLMASLHKGDLRTQEGLAGVAETKLTWELFDDATPRKDAEETCLTEALYFEARGESLSGQVAVAEVILNRVDREEFPTSVCKVVRQGMSGGLYACQFSYNCDGKPEDIADRSTYELLAHIARRMLDGLPRSLTHGATHYHATHVRPRWARRFDMTAEIGEHAFYREPSQVARY